MGTAAGICLTGIGEDGAVAGRFALKEGIHQIGQLVQTFAGLGTDVDDIHKRQIGRLDHITQVRLVDQGDGIFLLTAEVNDFLILGSQGHGTVADVNDQISLFHGFLRAFHAHGFDAVGGFPDAGGVDEAKAGVAHHDGFFHGVPGGASHFGDDDPVITGQGVQQAGLTDIGLANNGGGNALAKDAALTVGVQELFQSLGVGLQSAFIGIQTKIFNILVGIIQHRVEMGAEVGQVIVNGCQFFLEHTAHLTGGVGGGISGVGFDQVDDRFCLGQIQLTIQECPLGEFAPSGRFGAGDVQGFEACGQHGR